MGRPMWSDLRRAHHERSLAPLADRTGVPLAPKPRFGLAAISLLVAIAAIAGDANLSGLTRHGLWPHNEGLAWRVAMSAVFLVFGSVAARRFATQLGRLVHAGGGPAAGAAIRLTFTIGGILVVLIVTIGLLGVDPTKLLTAAGITGVIIGLAAQQSLGNVFAGIVLMVARPFTVGQRITVRSGSFGGIFEGEVRGMGLTYVEILSDDEGLIRVPNLGMLAAATGPASTPAPGHGGKVLKANRSLTKRPARTGIGPRGHLENRSNGQQHSVRLPREVIKKVRAKRARDPGPGDGGNEGPDGDHEDEDKGPKS